MIDLCKFSCLLFFLVSGPWLNAQSPTGALDVDGLLAAQLSDMKEQGEPVTHWDGVILRDKLRLDPQNLALLEQLFIHYQQQRNTVWSGLLASGFMGYLGMPESPMAHQVIKQARLNWEQGEISKLVEENEFYLLGIAKIRKNFQQGRVDEAEEELLNMLRDYQRDEVCLRLLAHLLIFQQEFRLAEVVLVALAMYHEPSFEVKNNLALCRYNMGLKEKAEQSLIALRVEHANEPAVYQNAALVAYDQKEMKDAAFFAGKWAATDPKNPLAWLFYGDRLLEKQNWVFARKAFRNVLVLTPDDPRAFYGLAQAALGIGETQVALRAIEQVRSTMTGADFQVWLKQSAFPLSIKEALQ